MSSRSSLPRSGGSIRQEEALEAVYLQAEAMLSETSISSTATMSDLPGAGRTLGLFYSWLGKKLERVVNRIAENIGYGPRAIEQRLLPNGLDQPPLEPRGKKERKKIMKDLKQLMTYASSEIESNRILAFKVIANLAMYTFDNQYIENLKSLGITHVIALACVRETQEGIYDGLLSPSRKAQICLIESDIHTIGREIICLANREQVPPSALLVLFNGFYALIEHIGDCSPDYSFLAMLYISKYSCRASTSNKRVCMESSYCSPELYNSFLWVLLNKFKKMPQSIDWGVFSQLIQRPMFYVTVKSSKDHDTSCLEEMMDLIVIHKDKFAPNDFEILSECREKALHYI